MNHGTVARVELRCDGSGIELLSSLITFARLQVGSMAARTFSKASAFILCGNNNGAFRRLTVRAFKIIRPSSRHSYPPLLKNERTRRGAGSGRPFGASRT
jgi:hypothetical protein